MTVIFKPYMLVDVEAEGYYYTGEAMSYITADHTLMVRRVPDHPGTLEEVGINRIKPLTKEEAARCRWVHYAAIDGRGSFPVDMLRYDRAAPVNFSLREDVVYALRPYIDPSFGWSELIIATCAPTNVAPWTYARWSSFLWGCRPFGNVLKRTGNA